MDKMAHASSNMAHASSNLASVATNRTAEVLHMPSPISKPVNAVELTRRVEKSGYLNKRADWIANRWKNRWFVIKGDTLFYYKTKGQDEPSGHLSLANALVQEAETDTGRKNSFKVTTPSGSYTLQAQSYSEMDGWVSVLQAASSGRSMAAGGGAAKPGAGLVTGKTTIIVRGLMCETCCKQITDTLTPLQGINTVEIDLERETVVIIGRPDTNRVLLTLENLGYLPFIPPAPK